MKGWGKMLALKKRLFVIVGILAVILTCGCGKLGEEAAEKLVQDNLKVKNSYKIKSKTDFIKLKT